MSRGAVDIAGLWHSFGDGIRPLPVIGGLDVSVRTGEIFCVLGPSGCGKTTLFHLIAGFLKPDRGRIEVSGRPVTGPGPDRAMVFQHPTLFPWLTAAGNICHALRGRCGEKVRKLVDLMGLSGFEDFYPHRLSGGMRQRVALARALALEPKVLLLDEPFSALDQLTRERLQDELLQLRRKVGCTMIFVTHNIQEAAYLGDRVMVLSRRPARINLLKTIDLPHPRKRTGEDLWRIEREFYMHCGCCGEATGLSASIAGDKGG